MKDDNKAILQDIERTRQALAKAEDHLKEGNRDAFSFYIGMARGRLSRIMSHIYGEPVPDYSGDSDP